MGAIGTNRALQRMAWAWHPGIRGHPIDMSPRDGWCQRSRDPTRPTLVPCGSCLGLALETKKRARRGYCGYLSPITYFLRFLPGHTIESLTVATIGLPLGDQVLLIGSRTRYCKMLVCLFNHRINWKVLELLSASQERLSSDASLWFAYSYTHGS